MNIHDPKISRLLAKALQWMPLEKRQSLLRRAELAKTEQELLGILKRFRSSPEQ